MAQKVIVSQKKNYVPQFLKQRDINSYCMQFNLAGTYFSKLPAKYNMPAKLNCPQKRSLRYSMFFNNETDQEDETEGIEMEGLEMER
jgi:hypothetical protein